MLFTLILVAHFPDHWIVCFMLIQLDTVFSFYTYRNFQDKYWKVFIFFKSLILCFKKKITEMLRYESDKTAIGSIHWKLQSVDERKQRKSKDMKRKGLPWWSSDLGSALQCKDFPGGSDGKASVYNSGDPGSIPRSGRSPGEGNGNPLQYYCLENPMDRGAW